MDWVTRNMQETSPTSHASCRLCPGADAVAVAPALFASAAAPSSSVTWDAWDSLSFFSFFSFFSFSSASWTILGQISSDDVMISVHISSRAWPPQLPKRSYCQLGCVCLLGCLMGNIEKNDILDLKKLEFLYFQLRWSSKVSAFRFLGADLTSPAMCTRTYSTHLTSLRKIELVETRVPGYCATPHCPTFQYVLFLASCLFWELAFK